MYPFAKKDIMAFERKQVEMETIMLNKSMTDAKRQLPQKVQRKTIEC